jgi:hypothetical protein
MCRRISTAFPSDDAEESERKMALVERVILQRAREFQMNGLRVNATKEERKESLNWAVAEIETIPNRASYVEHGWEKTDFDFVGKILLNLFLKNDEYEKALNHSEVLLNELKDEQLRILGQRLVEARGANDRSGITRYVIVCLYVYHRADASNLITNFACFCVDFNIRRPQYERPGSPVANPSSPSTLYQSRLRYF